MQTKTGILCIKRPQDFSSAADIGVTKVKRMHR